MFDVDENLRKRQIKRNREKAEAIKDPNTSESKKGSWFLIIILALCVLFAFVFQISGKIELDKINSEINDVSQRITEADIKNEYLKTSLEAMATPAKVEEYAAQNGLIREQSSQITYISVSVESPIEVNDSKTRDFFGSVNERFRDILEFLGVQ
jgi:cell division protein FtsL